MARQKNIGVQMKDLKELVRKNILDLKPYSSARDEYKAVLNKHTLSELKDNMYANHRDSLAGLGYASASELPLNHFTAHYSMYSTYSALRPMGLFEKDF